MRNAVEQRGGYSVEMDSWPEDWIPYTIRLWSAPAPDGREWLRYAMHPELPDCPIAMGETPEDALAQLERNRRVYLRTLRASGRPFPVPRPPLRV